MTAKRPAAQSRLAPRHARAAAVGLVGLAALASQGEAQGSAFEDGDTYLRERTVEERK